MALPWDEFARRTFLADTGRRALDGLSEETRGFVAAYVAGLNHGLADATAPELDQLALTAEPWPEWMPLAAFHAQQVLFANLGERAVGAADAQRARRRGAVAVGGGR